MDACGGSWWGIEQIEVDPVQDECAGDDPGLAEEMPTAVFFADYMIRSMNWAICCSEGPNRGRIFVVSMRRFFVSDTFAEFVDRYLSSDGAVF